MSDQTEIAFLRRSLEALQIELVLQNQRLEQTKRTPETVLWDDICGAILGEDDPKERAAKYESLDPPLRALVRESLIVRANAILVASRRAGDTLAFLGELEGWAVALDTDDEDESE